MTRSGRLNGIAFLFFSLSIAAASSGMAAPDGSATFGDKPTFQSDDQFNYGLSDDKKAFTILFSDVSAKSAAATTPIATRVFSIVIPVTGGNSVKTSFFASGFVSTSKGAQGTLVFSVNGKNSVASFSPGTQQSFVQELQFGGEYVSDARMTVYLLAERDSKTADAEAFLNVTAIDTDLALAQQRAKGGGKK
jgi:hypothetical protein